MRDQSFVQQFQHFNARNFTGILVPLPDYKGKFLKNNLGGKNVAQTVIHIAQTGARCPWFNTAFVQDFYH